LLIDCLRKNNCICSILNSTLIAGCLSGEVKCVSTRLTKLSVRVKIGVCVCTKTTDHEIETWDAKPRALAET